MQVCKACGAVKERAMFTSSQLAKPNTQRTCRDCVVAAIMKQ